MLIPEHLATYHLRTLLILSAVYSLLQVGCAKNLATAGGDVDGGGDDDDDGKSEGQMEMADDGGDGDVDGGGGGGGDD